MDHEVTPTFSVGYLEGLSIREAPLSQMLEFLFFAAALLMEELVVPLSLEALSSIQ